MHYLLCSVIVHGMMISCDWNRLETCYETVRWLTALIMEQLAQCLGNTRI